MPTPIATISTENASYLHVSRVNVEGKMLCLRLTMSSSESGHGFYVDLSRKQVLELHKALEDFMFEAVGRRGGTTYGTKYNTGVDS